MGLVLYVSGVRFNRAWVKAYTMKQLLHIGSKEYDYKNPSYACGEPITHNPNMTDADAMALRKCPKCFPNGFTAKVGASRTFVEEEPTKKSKVVEGLRERGIGGWL